MSHIARNQHWLPSIFNDFFGEDLMPMRTRQQAAPAINILEKEHGYCIEIAAPGMCKEDFNLSIEEDNRLVVALEKMDREEEMSEKTADKQEYKNSDTAEPKATKPAPQGEKEPTYLRREFSYSSFRQSFLLPDDVDTAHIEAKMKHGVLKIRLPKKEQRQALPASRQIEIK